MDVGRILFSEPVVAGFDATGDWHDGGNGRYAKPGWSTAKRAILGLVRGAFARDHAKTHDGPVRVTFRPDTAAATLRNLGAAVDRTVHVRYHSNEHGVINVDGRDRLVRWDMFTDTLPPPSVPVTQNMVDRGIAGGLRSLNTTPDNPDLIDRLTANAETMFTLDLDGGYTTAAQAEITILNSTRIADRNRADIEIVGQILNKDGDEIGEFDRVITANKFTGEVSILHETLSLDTEHQGNGVGTRFIQRTVEQYAAEGILRVNTHGSSSTESAYDAGAYVWARAGFDWDLRGVSERSVFLRSAEKVARNLEKPGDPPDGMDPEDAATVRAAGRDMAGRLRTLMGNVRDGNTDLTGMVTPFDVASVGTDRWPIGKQAMSTSNPYARTPSGMSMVDFMYTKDLVEHPDAFQAPVTQHMLAYEPVPKSILPQPGDTLPALLGRYPDGAPFFNPTDPDLLAWQEAVSTKVSALFDHDLGSGLRSRVTDANPHSAYGVIETADGKTRGRFQRNIRTGSTGVDVHHSLFEVNYGYRDQGIGARFIQASEDAYRDAGVDVASLHAVADGKIVWPKLGYDWDLIDDRLPQKVRSWGAHILDANPDDPLGKRLAAWDGKGYDGLPTPNEIVRHPMGESLFNDETSFELVKPISKQAIANHRKSAPATQDMVDRQRSPKEWAVDMGYNPKLIGTLETIRGGPKPFGYIESRAQNSGARGGADADIQDELYNLFADGAVAVAADRVMIRVPVGVLDSIEEAGRFKTQHESGTSRGMFSPLEREAFETDVFGVKKRSPASKAPVYGLVATDNVGTISHSQYGEVGFLLKGDRIAARTTLSAGDSLFEAVPIPVPSVEWSGEGDDTLTAAHAAAIGFVGDAMIRDRLEDRKFSTVAFEAQVHGGVTLDDVAGIVVFGSDAEPKARALADKLGVPLHVAPDSEEAMQQLRPGVDGDSLTPENRAAYGRTTYGDILPEKPTTQQMADRPVDLLFTDTTVNRIMTEYEAGGHDIQIVGGAIRSVLNGEIPNDMDLTTSATPEQSKALLASVGTVFPLGEKFGTVVVNVDGMDYEVTTYRTEIYDPVSRKPEVVFTKNLLEDLARRDFTFNAMAVGTDRNIIDPYGGANDLANKVVKAVGDPDERFTEDPLRIIRAVRFASVLGFTIDPETLAAARRNADRLDVVSTERFGGELNKILKSDVPGVIPQAAALAETVEAGDALFGPLLPAALRHKDVPAEHRFASLVYDAHRVDGVDPATLVDRMKRGRVEIRDIETVIKAADSLRGGEDPRLLVRRNTDQTLERLRVLDPGLWTSDLDRAYQDRVVLRAPLPVDGNDMKALGFEGAEIRTALGTVERLFVNGNSAMTRQEALDAVKPSATQQMVDVPYQIGAPADPATRVRVAQRNRSLIEQHHAALVSEMDDAMPLEEFVSEVVAGLDNMRAAGDPTIRVPWGAVPGIVADGRFKSQHETGVSSAAYVPGHRVSIEHSALGVPRDINPAMRPIFGVLEDTYEDGANGADAYGPVSFLLKRDVLNRSTMSFGDSGDLDVVPVRVTGDVTDDELLAAASDRTVNDVASAVQADALETDMWEGADMNEPGFYREIQIHGGLTLSDVLDVTYIPDEDQPETATAIQALTDAGLTPVTQWMAERPPTIAVGEPWPVDQIRHVDGGTFPVAKRTVQLPGGRTVNITDVGGDSQDGYYSATNVMFDAATGERMGHLSYSVGKGDLNIRMVETNPQFRREGVADALLSYTLVNSPDAKVNPGSLTDNGADWWPHVLSWLPDANKPDAPVTQNMVDRPDRTPDYFYEMDIAPVPDGVVQIGTEYLGDPSEPGGVIARTMWETSARPVETAAREVRADRIEVAIPSSTVEAVISAGRLMSQHESKSSRGMYDPELRRRVESRYFGIPGSHPKVDMPIYGFVAEAGTTPSIYGGVILRMKPAVAERTTVTFGDSLLTSDVTILRPAPVVGLTDATVSALKQATPPRGFYRNNDYVEAQIHGGVRIRDDVDTVVLRGTFHDENTIAALQLADHLGVPLTVDRTVHRQIHRRNMESALKQHPELAAVTVQYESPDYMLGDPATPREDQYVLQLLGSPYTIDDVRNLLKDGSLTDTQRHDLNMILLQLEVP